MRLFVKDILDNILDLGIVDEDASETLGNLQSFFIGINCVDFGGSSEEAEFLNAETYQSTSPHGNRGTFADLGQLATMPGGCRHIRQGEHFRW
jgi:hypothetical protein